MKNTSKLTWIAMVSVPVSILVFTLKYFSWKLTGSVALYSDALESVVNIIAALAAWLAIYFSMKPADRNHPFGHHKAEYFSSVFEGALILLAAILIVHKAWDALHTPRMLEHSGYGLIINLMAGIINASWAYVLIRNGKRYRSPAIEASGKHLVTDVITSAGVIAGLFAAVWSEWSILDPLLAMIVVINILWQGWKVVSASIQGLMDAGVEMEEVIRIRDIISSHAEGALEVHDLRTRIAGRVTFIELHLVVPSMMTVGHAHTICDLIENALKNEIDNTRVVIHVEPENEAKLPLGTKAVPFV